MNHRYLIALVTCCLAGFASSARADLGQAFIYVEVDGDDAASGADGKPVRTLERAQELVRTHFATIKAPAEIVVSVGAGTFVFDRPLRFTAADKPPANVTVAYHGRRGEARTYISGGRQLAPWRVEGKVWKIDVPEAKDGAWAFRDLYINSERRHRARTPDEGYYRVEKAGADRRTSFKFKPGELKAVANPSAAEVVFLHDWSISRIPIKAIDETAATVSFTHSIGNAAPHYAIDHFEPNPRYFLEGAPEYLDAPGEWHLDTKAGVLSYLPRAGESPESCVAIAPHLETLLEAKDVSDTHFARLTFAHTHWALPAGGYAGSQASFHEDRSDGKQPPGRKMVPAAILVDDCSSIVFNECTFQHLGGSGLYLRRNRTGCTVKECAFRDIGANGLMVGDTVSRDKGNTALMLIWNNTVTQCGQLDYGAVGIWAGIASDLHISGNTVHDLPYTGISVGWRWDPTPTACKNNIVTDNHIHHVLQVMSDGGGIYTLGRQPGMQLTKNKIHDIPANLGRAESNGIFMDEGSTEILVKDNVIYNLVRSPIRFHKAGKNVVVENTLVARPGVPHFRYNSTDEKLIAIDRNQLLSAEKWSPPDE